MAADFLDTNVLVYAYDPSEPDKAKTAQALVARAVAREFVISAQVLAEFATSLLHKVAVRRTADDVKIVLDILAPIPVIASDRALVRRAVEARAQYGLHFYDGMIIAAAERAGSEKIWSEDLNADQKYFGVTVVNPFR